MMKKHSTRRNPMLATADAKIAQLELDKLVQDRKTGLYYNPQEAFDAMMNKPEILAVFKRLSIR
jgi:hypothetical protein